MIDTLVAKTCTPCRGGVPPLTPQEAEHLHLHVPQWEVRDEVRRIERTFRIPNFRCARSTSSRTRRGRRYSRLLSRTHLVTLPVRPYRKRRTISDGLSGASGSRATLCPLAIRRLAYHGTEQAAGQDRRIRCWGAGLDLGLRVVRMLCTNAALQNATSQPIISVPLHRTSEC